MIELTGKQKRHLRRLGQKLPAVTILGKAGLTDAAAGQLKGLLARRELVKVRLPVRDAAARDELAAAVARVAGATLAAAVGHTALLYKPNPDLPPDDRIALPDG